MDLDDDLTFEEAYWELRRRQYLAKLLAHPDCRDPDHPGCVYCWEEKEDEDEI